MKQITHEFKWEHVMAALINEYSEDFDDGYWQLGLRVEHYANYVEQAENSCPGIINRVIGIVISKVDDWWPNTVKIEKGVIHFGPNRDQNGSLPSGESPGENSEEVGHNVSGS